MVAVNHKTSTYANSIMPDLQNYLGSFGCKKNNVDFIMIDRHHEDINFRFGIKMIFDKWRYL